MFIARQRQPQLCSHGNESTNNNGETMEAVFYMWSKLKFYKESALSRHLSAARELTAEGSTS
jgi:hypothetical protein